MSLTHKRSRISPTVLDSVIRSASDRQARIDVKAGKMNRQLGRWQMQLDDLVLAAKALDGGRLDDLLRRIDALKAKCAFVHGRLKQLATTATTPGGTAPDAGRDDSRRIAEEARKGE